MKVPAGLKLPLRPFQSAAAAGRQLIRTADRLRDAREWEAAARHYQRALRLVPDRGDIWVQYGHAVKEGGQIRAAVAAYQEALVRGADPADTQLQLGHALKLQGRMEEAAAAYVAALSHEGGLAPAITELEALGLAPDGRRLPEPDGLAEDDEPRPPGLPQLKQAAAGVQPGEAGPAALDLLRRAGLSPGMLPFFDAPFYLRQHGLRPAAGSDALLTGLTHFIETGLEAGAAVNERMPFDPAFYAGEHVVTFRMSDADRYRNWLNLGLRQGQAPNLTVWLQDVAGLPVGGIESIDLKRYRAAAPELDDMPDTRAVEWLVDGGLLDGRLDGAMDENRVELFTASAHRASVRGDTTLALRFLERVLSERPLLMPTLEHYADRLTDSGQFFPAAEIYRKVLGAGLQTRTTHMHLYVCLTRQRRWREAFEVIDAGVTAFPQYPILHTDRTYAMDAYRFAAIREYETLARVGRVAEGQALITQYCEAVTAPRKAERLPAKPIRAVALFSLMDLPQCRFYRVDQKVEQLEHAGFEVSVYDFNTGLADFQAAIRRFQAVIFYRLAPLPEVVEAIAAAREMGLVTFYEIDDLLFLAKEYPGSLESYAGQITRETHTMLSMGVPLFLAAMRMCDYAIGSTPILAREMAPFVGTGRAFVHRNGLGSDHERYLDYQRPARPVGRPVTIFYGSGTRAHKEDYQQLIEPALIEIARRHRRNVAFVMVGWLPVSDAFREAASQLTLIEPIFDLHEYWDLLKEADINLAVLKPSLNVDCKSEIKWMEAGLFGIPSVVSRTVTYAEVIEEGRTGFMCDTVADWVRTLDRLVRDPGLRREVGLAAQAVVRRDYGIPVMAENLRAIMQAAGPAVLPDPARKKVLVVNVFYAPQTYGGATRVVHDNVTHLAQSYADEFEMEVFTCFDDSPAQYVVRSYAQDGVAVTGISRSGEGEKIDLFDPKMAEVFRDHLVTTRPDLIHFHCIQRLTATIVMVAKELGIPYVITAHDAWWISDNQFLLDAIGEQQTYDYADARKVLAQQGQRAFARMQRLRPAITGARAVLGVSEPFSALYRRCGVPNVRTVANGVSALATMPRTTSPDGRVRLGFVGGLTPHKGFDLIKQALQGAEFENLSLLAIDHGRPAAYRRQENWGTTPVSLVGRFPSADVASLYAGIDVLLAPSVWAESYGLVTREAQACGCWVVASDRGAIGSDVTEGVDGHIIDVSDCAGLVRVLRRIDGDPRRYLSPPPQRRMRQASDQGDELAALYRELLAPQSAL